MTGGNGDAAPCAMMTDQQLDCRHGAHADINDSTATGEQAGDHRLPDHLARGARISSDDNRPRANIGTERLGKARQQFGRQGIPDYSANAGDANFESGYRSQCSSPSVITYAICRAPNQADFVRP